MKTTFKHLKFKMFGSLEGNSIKSRLMDEMFKSLQRAFTNSAHEISSRERKFCFQNSRPTASYICNKNKQNQE
jgi:hypothetical protein